MIAAGAEGTPETYLRALIGAEGGSISVERFMQEALYHPRYGYYAGRIRSVGRQGDFSTSATLHPALGRAIAAWVAAHRAEVTRRGAWHLIELGGGSGQVAAEVLRSVGWWTRLGLRYHLVEISEGLRAGQRERLAGFERTVRWHETVQSALAAADGRALLFSNEFVDAFPCAQLFYDAPAGRWREVRVQWPDDSEHPGETFGDWDGPTPGVAGGGNRRVEMHLTYRRWLEECVGAWRQGRMLTVDYGDVPPGLYHRRPHGTLRAYFRHQRVSGPEVYRRFGRQDLTADVNFADLVQWGDALGLASLPLLTQGDFLRRWLPTPVLKRASAEPALACLLDPDGAGGAFKVLEQTR